MNERKLLIGQGRPSSVTLVGWLFVAAGMFGFAYHAAELKTQVLFEAGPVWVLFVRFLAVIGGVFVLRGANWARWLLIVWLAYHVILSMSHSLSELGVHLLLLALIAFILLRQQASGYFQGTT